MAIPDLKLRTELVTQLSYNSALFFHHHSLLRQDITNLSNLYLLTVRASNYALSTATSLMTLVVAEPRLIIDILFGCRVTQPAKPKKIFAFHMRILLLLFTCGPKEGRVTLSGSSD